MDLVTQQVADSMYSFLKMTTPTVVLMGANMQRQAALGLIPKANLYVGTGMNTKQPISGAAVITSMMVCYLCGCG